MTAADEAREWLEDVERQSAANFNPAGSWGLNSVLRGGTTQVRALLAELDRADGVVNVEIVMREEAEDATRCYESKLIQARAALDELVSHGDLTPSGRRVLRSILGGDS